MKDDWTSVNKQQLNSEEEIEEELDDEGLDLDEYEDAYEVGHNEAEQDGMLNVSNSHSGDTRTEFLTRARVIDRLYRFEA